MAKILIVEDDSVLKGELSKFLNSYGFETTCIDEFKNVVKEILNTKADIVILDVNLPYYDGYYICSEIRKSSNIPIIIVTSRDTDMDELMGLNLGADDFVAKPFNPQILLKRILTALKRTMPSVILDEIYCHNVSLNLSRGALKYNEKEVELTKSEQKILYILMRATGKIVSKEEIINELWQSNDFVDDNTLNVYINRLRKKLAEVGLGKFLITKRGQGYIV